MVFPGAATMLSILALQRLYDLGINHHPCQLTFQVDHRLLVPIPLQVLTDPAVPLSLLLVAQFTNSPVISPFRFLCLFLELLQFLLYPTAGLGERPCSQSAKAGLTGYAGALELKKERLRSSPT
jgi:hypothetical protein